MKRFLSIFLTLVACAPSSLEEFRWEGESIALQLATELSKVHQLEDLRLRENRIKKKLDHLADLVILADNYLRKQADAQISNMETGGSKKLEEQIKRIYAIEGGQEAFEAITKSSLQKLQLTVQARFE